MKEARLREYLGGLDGSSSELNLRIVEEIEDG